MDSSYEDSPPSNANGTRIGLVQKRISKFTSSSNFNSSSVNNSSVTSSSSPRGHVRSLVKATEESGSRLRKHQVATEESNSRLRKHQVATEESNSRLRKHHVLAPRPFSKSNGRAKTEVISTVKNHNQAKPVAVSSKSFGAADVENRVSNGDSASETPFGPRVIKRPFRAAPLPDAPLSSATSSPSKPVPADRRGLALARLVNVVSQEEPYENLQPPQYENMVTSEEQSVDDDLDNGDGRLGDRTPNIPPRLSESVKPVIPPKPKKLSSSSISPKSYNNNNRSSFDHDLELEPNVDPQIYNSREMLKRIQSKSVSFCSIDDASYDRSALLERRRSCSEFQDLIQKKSEIRERILSKINILRDERDCILEEKQENDLVGQAILSQLESVASATEVDRVHNYLQEVEQITKLTVGLNIRLNRIDKMLDSKKIQNRSNEKASLQSKKSKLLDQIKEARSLQANTERRGKNIRAILAKHLGQNTVETFDGFLSGLVCKITELKETDQRVQMGEEQLVALNDSSSNNSFNNSSLNLSWQMSPVSAAVPPGASLNSSLGSLSEH